ncbi:MAG: beta-hydroxyacyl-ACP dehydratase [Xanthobacteraceae bacterium]|nr:beta-hydroxyacyl-ACP dehydratase [Xanthobacteraceae bacterium]
MQLEYFRLIDRIVTLDTAARTIQCEADVPTQSTIFDGHFPGMPLMPGVLLMETMAQASGWLILGLTNFAGMPLLAAFKEAKLRSFIAPGTALIVNASIHHQGSGFAVTHAEIRRGERLVCNAEITFRLMPFPNDAFLTNLKAVAASIGFPIEASADG